MTNEQIGGFRVSIARMEGKLDAALSLRVEFEAYEKTVNGALLTLQLQMSRLESFKAVAVWVAGIVGMVLAGAIGTIFAFLLNRGP